MLQSHDGPDLLSIADVCKRLGLSIPTVRSLLGSRLKFIRVGRRVLIQRASLEALVRGESVEVSR